MNVNMRYGHIEKPVGFVSEDRQWIYIGHGEWIPYSSYCNIKFGAKQPSQFVKKMAVAVYGVDTLMRSTISGKGSNRNKQQIQPQETLDPIKLLAIKDIYRYYLITVLGKIPEQADYFVEKARYHISHKIAGMKSKFEAKKRQQSQPQTQPQASYPKPFNVFRLEAPRPLVPQQNLPIDPLLMKQEKQIPEDDSNCIYIEDDM